MKLNLFLGGLELIGYILLPVAIGIGVGWVVWH
jgi:hypothetical protein